MHDEKNRPVFAGLAPGVRARGGTAIAMLCIGQLRRCAPDRLRAFYNLRTMAIVASPHSVDTNTPAQDAHDVGGISLGELLRHAREDRGLTLDTIANETKIPRRHLEALEHDNLAAAPGRFYQRAEIRAYARAVGIDQNRALARLEALLKTDESEKAPVVEVPQRRDPSTMRAYVQVGLGVALMAAAALLGRPLFKDTPTLLDGSAASETRPALQTTAAPPQGQPDAVALVSAPQESLVLSGTPVTAAVIRQEPAVITQEPAAAETPVPTGEVVASPAAVTELVVTTQPEGARVTVNGVGWGTSPVTIRYLTTGDKRIRVSKEGYLAKEQVLHVSEGHRQALTIQLETAQ